MNQDEAKIDIGLVENIVEHFAPIYFRKLFVHLFERYVNEQTGIDVLIVAQL